MSNKEKIQELATEVLHLEHLCKAGETDGRKLEKQLNHVADLARDVCCAQYNPKDDDKSFDEPVKKMMLWPKNHNQGL